MIFVTLGTQNFQFNRLLVAIDSLVSDRVINDDVYAQSGFSTYSPKHFKTGKFLDQDEFNDYLLKSSYIITHAGTGTIVPALKIGKKVIVVPRLKKFSEHVDDHQLEIASMFSARNFVCMANSKDELKEAVLRIDEFEPSEFTSGNKTITTIINDFICREFNA